MNRLKLGLCALAVMMVALPGSARDRTVDLTGSVSFIHLKEGAERSLEVENDLGFTAAMNVFIGERVSLDVSAGVFEPEASIDLPTSRTPGRISSAAIKSAAVGKVKMIPLTAALQYHFKPDGKFDPYIGGGIEYILLGDFDSPDDVDFEDIDFDDDLGAMITGGLGIKLGRSFAIDLNAKYVPTGDAVKTSGSTPLELELRPLILSAGLSFRF